MADRKFDSLGKGKRPYSSKPDWKEKGEGSGDRKAFKSKFTRKGPGDSAADKPARATRFAPKNDEGGFSSAPRKKFSDRPGDDKKGYARKSGPPAGRTGPGSYSRGGDKPGFGKSDSGFGRKKFSDDKKGSFANGPRKDFDKPFGKKGEGESSDNPRFEANRAFSAGKKYFKKREDGPAGSGEERKRPFDKDSALPAGRQAPHRGRAKAYGSSSYGKPKRFSSTKKRDVMTEGPKDGLIRLNKFISNSGVCSRREADELIKMGLISVNGQVITEMGFKVKPTDDVRHESKKLHAEKPVYVLLNKPKGYITTTDDPQERKTVMGLIGNAVKERIYPVGRLDRNTTGLLLLTNDGDLADKLTHPSYQAKKLYKVELDKPLTKADFDRIVEGVRLEEGKAVVDDLAYVDDDKKTIGIELHIGWNRIVRRIFEFLEYEVVKLDRVIYAGLDKKNLGRGEWRFLNDQEVVKLKHLKS